MNKLIKKLFPFNKEIIKETLEGIKGYTDAGFAEKVFRLHLRYTDDNDELYFKDYLNDFHDVAKDYEKLKLSL